jgi:hypothetical protein
MHVDRKPPPGSATSYAILFIYFHGIISSMHVLFAGGSANHKVTTSKITSTASPPAKITQKRIYKEASPSPIPPHHHPASSVVITIITQLAQWSSQSSPSRFIPPNQLSGHHQHQPTSSVVINTNTFNIKV